MATITIDYESHDFVLTVEDESASSLGDMCQALSQGPGVASVTLRHEHSNVVDTWTQGANSFIFVSED